MATLKLKQPSNRAKTATPAQDARIVVLERYLQRRYPDLFPRTGKPVPLAIGIRQKFVLPPGARKADLREFLKGWCSRPEYLARLAEGGHRYGLNGPDGTVTPAQQKRAERRLVKTPSDAKKG